MIFFYAVRVTVWQVSINCLLVQRSRLTARLRKCSGLRLSVGFRVCLGFGFGIWGRVVLGFWGVVEHSLSCSPNKKCQV